ncbi:hypothetical protein [Vibrio harveyi]|uniref:Uncharacterized protein n=1 Tax=Vibrio harveyi TaxID=669 RepID=A0ABM5XTC6_VIBHA|nr:hypothetical protein [Vibrio harveyi]AMF96307.1 hypothetical protein AL538_00495 [Vibrio harveyi]
MPKRRLANHVPVSINERLLAKGLKMKIANRVIPSLSSSESISRGGLDVVMVSNTSINSNIPSLSELNKIKKKKVVSEEKRNNTTERVIAKNFVTKIHMEAIKNACDMFNLVVTFREAGEFTIRALNRGAASKGHDILEKTIKPSTLKSTYKLTKDQEKVLKDEDLMGVVGHLNKEKNTLGGVYSSIYEHGDNGQAKAKIIPLNTETDETLRSSILSMKKELGENWQQRLFSGDYDTHDVLVKCGKRSYKVVPPESKEEGEAIENLNMYVAAHDKKRPFHPYNPNKDHVEQSRHVIRHGAQVNYVWHQMIAEPNARIVKQVAQAGDFPLAYYSSMEGKWGIITSFKELKDLYVNHNAELPFYWRNTELDLDTGAVKYQSFNYEKKDIQHITVDKSEM